MPGTDPRLNCVIEGEYKILQVTVEHSCWMISYLKEVIQNEAKHGTLKDVDPYTLELWKVSPINDLRFEMTSLFSAQGPYRCEARKDFGCTCRVPGRWSFGICGHIRTYGQGPRYLFNVASQIRNPHNCKGPIHW